MLTTFTEPRAAAAHARLDRARADVALGGRARGLDVGLGGRRLRRLRRPALDERAARCRRARSRSPAPTCASPRSPPVPHDDAVAVLESAPRAARGFDAPTRRSSPRAPSPAAPAASPSRRRPSSRRPGANSAPSVAIDPGNDRAVVAWQTTSRPACPRSPTRCARRAVGRSPAHERADREQAEGEAADVRVVGDAGAAAERRRDAEGAEQRVEDQPQAEHRPGRQLDEREEEDQQHDGQDPRPRVEQDVAAEHGGDRARGAERRRRRVGADGDRQRERGDARRAGRRRGSAAARSRPRACSRRPRGTPCCRRCAAGWRAGTST